MMAEPVADDQNLDDFFAKKDKTKKKAKSRFTPDEIELQMEKKLKKKSSSSSSSSKKKEKDSSSTGQTSVLASKLEEDDGEWKDVEEEAEADYSDLRIQNLKLSSKDEEDKERQDGGQNGEEGDERGGKDCPQGPWKSIPSSGQAVAAAPHPPAAAAAATEKPFPAETEKEPAKPGKYVPPGARRAQQAQQTSGAGSAAAGGGRKQKTAPNVNSQFDFPSLAATAADYGDSQDFERVRSGGRQIEDPSTRHVKLALGNKYGALEGKDS